MKANVTTSRGAIVAMMAVLATAPVRAQSLVLGGTNSANTFLSAYKFHAHYASGHYWTALRSDSCSAGRIRLYSSPDGSTWSEATGSPAFSFCAQSDEWAARFLGNVVVFFAYNGGDTARYYSKGTLGSDGTVTWQRQDYATGLPTGATDRKLNAAIVNGKPVLWGADEASPGRISIGSSLDSPTWTNVVNPTALGAGLGAGAGTNGIFSAGAVLPLRSDDPNDLMIIRATTQASVTAQAHRVVSIKLDAGTNTFDASWFNVSTVGGSLTEDLTTEVWTDGGGTLTDVDFQRRFAAARQSDGNLHVVYVNRSGNVVHYRRSAGLTDLDAAAKFNGWVRLFTDVDGTGSAVAKVGLTLVDGNNLYLFYSRAVAPETLYYRRFDGRAWGAETTIRGSVDLNGSFGAMEVATGCNAGVAWNENTDPGPYDVYFRVVNPSCTAPTYYYRSIGTAADYTVGSVTVATGSSTVDGVGGPTWRVANRGPGDVLTTPCPDPPTCTGGVHYVIGAVNSETRLTLTAAYAGGPGTYTYAIRRQFQAAAGNAAPALIAWENCIDGGPCPAFAPGFAASGNLVNDNRVEVGVLYNDSVIQPPDSATGGVQIRGAETSATHRVILTVAPGNRHNGTPAAAGCTTTCASAVYQGSGTTGADVTNVLRIYDSNVTVEWLEFRGFRGGLSGSMYAPVTLMGNTSVEVVQNAVLDHLLIHDFADTDSATSWEGVRSSGDCCKSATLRNSMIWDGDYTGFRGDELGDSFWIENCTVESMHGTGSNNRGIATEDSVFTVRNTIVTTTSATRDFQKGIGSYTLDSSNNTSSDLTAPGANFQRSVLATNLYMAAGSDPHLKTGAVAIDTALDLSSSLSRFDIDGQLRPAGAAWDRGADEFGATTAVRLMSFEAVGTDGAVDLAWQTGSELDNLGFHLYRSLSDSGPWARLTSFLIPGLGSSPVGASYAWRDSGLLNGTRYFYRLEDVDTSSVSTWHGPVSAVPASSSPGEDGAADGGEDDAERVGSDPAGGDSCPSWVLAAAPDAVSPTCTRHGAPESVSLDVLTRDSLSATLELRTGGFYALREPAGGVRVFVPGFDFPSDPRAPALPFRRVLVDAVVGRGVELDTVRGTDEVGFPGLVPTSLGETEMRVSWDGTVRAGRRALGASVPGRVPVALARLLPSVFQGETKSAVVEISPLRFDAGSQQLLLARRVLVRLVFTGREAGEIGRGSIGRARPFGRLATGELLARLYTSRLGLHAVSFEAVFPGRTRGFLASALRLERQGRAQAFHLEPASGPFGPGSRLYFHADTKASSTDYSSETAWELVRSPRGVAMPLLAGAPAGDTVSSPSTGRASFETNRFYLPGLLEAPDPWLWDSLAAGATKTESFALTGVDATVPGPAELDIVLQGGSESGNPVDHHVAVSVNGVPAGDAQFAGKGQYHMAVSVPASLLREGENELSLTNVPDTGVFSHVYLDRFTVSFPQRPSLAGGVFEGTWSESGTATLVGLAAAAVVLDVTGAPDRGASWVTGYETTAGSLRFRVEAGHRYLALSGQGLVEPRVAAPSRTALRELRSAENQADYVLIAPRAFLAAAGPLLERRRGQGLRARAVALEKITDEFGHGQPSAAAIRDFLAFAFHSWTRPSPRYVLLLGDSHYDPRNFSGSSPASPLPALWKKTSYLWTVSDPELAAVNGEDPLPDLAIGRLPATTVAEAQALVEKLLAWEDSGRGLSGRIVLVADNPDLAGDFDGAVDDVARSFLQGRDVSTLRLSELGAGTRGAIRDALDSGLSLLSYVGHGGVAVWASENVWNTWDAPSLRAQSEQPVLLTLNCLNGYFVGPAVDSLAESLLKAEGRGAIAAFSPSGLSLDGPAHQYHRALMAELAGGQHERLGDAFLAAQKAYAGTGLMPELLTVYHLLGDPALRIR